MHTTSIAALALLPLAAVYAQNAAIVTSGVTSAASDIKSGIKTDIKSVSNSTAGSGMMSSSTSTMPAGMSTTTSSIASTTTAPVGAGAAVPGALDTTSRPPKFDVKILEDNGSEVTQYWTNGTLATDGARVSSVFMSKLVANHTQQADAIVTSTSTKTLGTTSRTTSTSTTGSASGSATQQAVGSDASTNAGFVAWGSVVAAVVVAVGFGTLL